MILEMVWLLIGKEYYTFKKFGGGVEYYTQDDIYAEFASKGVPRDLWDIYWASDDWAHEGPYYKGHHEEPCDGDHCLGGTSKITDNWEITDINLGLVRREQPDIALSSDIAKVKVVENEREYIYLYGKRGLSSNVPADYKVAFTEKYTDAYTRPLNPSNIAASKAGTHGLEVYVTYNIYVLNNSATLPVKVSEIINMYDTNYSIIPSSGWSDTSSYNTTYTPPSGYKIAYNKLANEIVLDPNMKSGPIEIEFRVDTKKILELMTTDEVLLLNMSEIGAYSTLYGDQTIVAENRIAKDAGVSGRQYAGIDINSEPGNYCKYPNEEPFEDDTDTAPVFKLSRAEYKTLSGTVFEDSATKESLNNNERLGDGILGDNEETRTPENRVKDVKVELLDETGNVAKLLGIDDNGGVREILAETYTDNEGKFTFGSNSSKYGVVVDKDNYTIRFTYGNNSSRASTINSTEINARNYKSTIITNDFIKNVIEGTAGNDEWYLSSNIGTGYSVAVDDITERANVDNYTLKSDNYDGKANMIAYTAPFAVHVEYTGSGKTESAVDENGGTFATDCNVFNFGIIERPRENFVIEKTIQNFKITQANGQVLTEGNPYTDDMSYVKALGTTPVRTRDQYLTAKEKQLSVEVNPEIIQSARMDIVYSITLRNNSEKDYEYTTNYNYYYYGVPNGSLIQDTIKLVVDYADAELIAGNNPDWEQHTAEELYSLGYITADLRDAIKNNGYSIFTTTGFNSTASGSETTLQLVTSKLLSNAQEDQTYENHTEIIAVNGKVARTISKKYKPGNYVPSLLSRTTDPGDPRIGISTKLHEQDDDDIIIRITKETGLENNIIIYGITGLIGLIFIVGGIILIKKKVLNK